jgi:hypothetical protein
MATQFTTGTSPQTGSGQVWVENSNGEWEIANVTAPGVVRQIFTADGTYTPSPGMILCEVIATGAGGGGGYARTTTDGDTAAGGGGQAGGTAIKLYTPAEIGATAAIVIGSGGTGGEAATPTAGTDGGTTTFTPTGTGATLTCDGGDVGSSEAIDGTGSGNSANGGSSNGTATGGDINISGDDGRSGNSWYDSGASKECGLSGDGGGSYWGGRGRGTNMSGSSANFTATGQDAEGYGSGGGGGVSRNGGKADGGDGSAGIVVVTEYIRQSVLSPIVYDSAGTSVLDFTTDNAVHVTATSGLSFDAGTNYLDDYEEGTWTPALTGNSYTYTRQDGFYVKVGNLVWVQGHIIIATVSGTSNSKLSGLPYALANLSGPAYYPTLMLHTRGCAWNGADQVFIMLDNNATTGALMGSVENGSRVDITGSQQAASDEFWFSGCYRSA